MWRAMLHVLTAPFRHRQTLDSLPFESSLQTGVYHLSMLPFQLEHWSDP